ncbi:hypothetical protein PENSPDRAFT_42516 [Peniophora sp. CONT]|nr:hypothetical protein PENSPDRAFT_42516 [Peniophora sp. CONT]
MSQSPPAPSEVQTDPPIKPLTLRQERRLREALEERFMDLTRNSKKRTDESSTMRTLDAYLTAARPLLALILQIPPAGSSASLRTLYLLRYTNDTFTAISGYNPQPEAVSQLKQWLDVLDRGWVAVLQRKRWDPVKRDGAGASQGCPGVSVTERTRLKSLLLSGTESLAVWLEQTRKAQAQELAEDAEDTGLVEEIGEEQIRLDTFDGTFSRTLDELGERGDDTPRMTGLVEPEMLLQSELEGEGDMLAFDEMDEE